MVSGIPIAGIPTAHLSKITTKERIYNAIRDGLKHDLSPGARHALLILAIYETSGASLHNRELATLLGESERTTREILAELALAGLRS